MARCGARTRPSRTSRGARSAKPVVHPGGLTANPVLTVLAGEGLLAGRVPPELRAVVADGYQHLDVLTASAQQNNGRPEVVSTSLAEFARSPR